MSVCMDLFLSLRKWCFSASWRNILRASESFALPPRLPPGLCPWTALGDFHSPDSATAKKSWIRPWYETSSPAFAERPRDVSCLSVVSFNSTLRRAYSSVISYFRFRFTAAYKWIMFSSLQCIHWCVPFLCAVNRRALHRNCDTLLHRLYRQLLIAHCSSYRSI